MKHSRQHRWTRRQILRRAAAAAGGIAAAPYVLTSTALGAEGRPPASDRKDVVARYADGVRLVIRRGLRFGSCPVRFEGDEGWVEVGDSGQMEVHPASLMAERRFRGGYPADDHVRNFLDCVKSRKRPRSHAETVHRSISTCHAANICVRLGRKLTWDPIKEEFVGDEDANRLRSRTYRVPWRL